MPEANGSAPLEIAPDVIDAPEDPIVTGLRGRVEVRAADVKRLKDTLYKEEAQLKRDEKALALLSGEVNPIGRMPGPQAPKQQRVREKPSGVSEERLERIRETILKLDMEEFRQVDVRALIDITSGVSALGFEALRQRGFLRVARQEGNSKFYRLTREALREQQALAAAAD